MNKNGIDISHWQGKPDFAKLKSQLDFIIIQAGFGRVASQIDSEYERNYRECKKYGIPCGAYWFSYATDPADAKLEAYACIDVLKGKQFEYPIYYDIEGAACSGDVSGKCQAFCDTLENAGYFAGIYISRSPAQQYLNEYCRKKYALWLAEYGGRVNWTGAVGVWQNSDSGHFDGITGNVDTDICYVDYPAMIKSGGFNGFPKPTTAEPLALDTDGLKKGDKNIAVLMYKQLLQIANREGIIKQTVKNDGGFGDGTEIATNELLKYLGYEQNGIAGVNLAKKLGVIL